MFLYSRIFVLYKINIKQIYFRYLKFIVLMKNYEK